jgi:hypothetical protein
MTDPKQYRKWVTVSFLITLVAVILVAMSYMVDDAELSKAMAIGGFSLAIASMILRWISKLKPEWLNGRSSNQNNS